MSKIYESVTITIHLTMPNQKLFLFLDIILIKNNSH